MTDIVERLRALNADFLHEEAAVEIERLRDIEAAYDLNQANSYRAIMMWEEAHSKRASGIHEVELLTWLLDEVEKLRAALLKAEMRAEIAGLENIMRAVARGRREGIEAAAKAAENCLHPSAERTAHAAVDDAVAAIRALLMENEHE